MPGRFTVHESDDSRVERRAPPPFERRTCASRHTSQSAQIARIAPPCRCRCCRRRWGRPRAAGAERPPRRSQRRGRGRRNTVRGASSAPWQGLWKVPNNPTGCFVHRKDGLGVGACLKTTVRLHPRFVRGCPQKAWGRCPLPLGEGAFPDTLSEEIQPRAQPPRAGDLSGDGKVSPELERLPATAREKAELLQKSGIL